MAAKAPDVEILGSEFGSRRACHAAVDELRP